MSDATLPRAGLFGHDAGMIEWESTNPTNTAKHSFRYDMQHFSDSPEYRHLHLVRSNCQGETERQVIVLMSSPQRLGGVRWYFFCPMWCHRAGQKAIPRNHWLVVRVPHLPGIDLHKLPGA